MQDTIILKTYKYIWKEKDSQNLCVKFITGTDLEHVKFQETLKNTETVETAMREYVHEINMAYFGFTEPVKTIEKRESEVENEKA